jgi:hypothetical protein
VTPSGDRSAYPDVDARADLSPDPRGKRSVLDFVLFAMLPMTELDIGGLPLPELAMVAAIFVAMWRRPFPGRPLPAWLYVLLPALIGWMVVSAQLNDLTPYRRLLHLALYVALAFFTAQGRFYVRSMAPGLATGLLVSAAAFYAGYGGEYEGRLTGLMADPNAAGYMLTVLGCIALGGLEPGRWRNLVGVGFLAAVVLTYSRTSLLAVLLILVWSVIGRRLSTGLGVLLLTGMIFAVAHFPASLKSIGPFADRTGSDALRSRILAQEQLQILASPWTGNGPGTSKVEVLGNSFFFHNSYIALQNEGGRIALALLLLAGLAALVGLVRLGDRQRNVWYEAAIIAAAVCAINLGEVLLELPTALALGMAAFHARTAGLDEQEETRATVPRTVL